MTTGTSEQDDYYALYDYTLTHGDPSFIHQHIVDAFGAQHANEQIKPIALTFALVGLYLSIEQGYTGKMVQRAHMHLARERKAWPRFPLPDQRGAITASDILAAAPGPDRDHRIQEWCACVWDAYRDVHADVARLVREELG